MVGTVVFVSVVIVLSIFAGIAIPMALDAIAHRLGD